MQTITSPHLPFVHRWYGRLALLVLSVLLLTLSLAPVKQFYLAWVGLVPWLWVIGRCKSTWRAFLWSWLAGTLYFWLNMWWLIYISLPATIALMFYLGLYWAVPAIIFRKAGWVGRAGDPSGPAAMKTMAGVFGIAVVYTAFEWLRGTLLTGLPWLYLGHSQSPFLIICQIADLAGVYGITFLLAATNAVVLAYINGHRLALRPALAIVLLLWTAAAGYGVFRRHQAASCLTPGPAIMLVQPNYPQDNTGNKGATDEERLAFHLDATRVGLRKNGAADLVCWSETMMPPLNEEFRQTLRDLPRIDQEGHALENQAEPFDAAVARIGELCRAGHTNLLTGGLTYQHLNARGRFTDRRNSAFLFRRDGLLSPDHADKTHLVPFGEFMPFKDSRWFHWLYRIFMSFSPYDFDYTLTAGSEDEPTVMTIGDSRPSRFIVPICFEDIDARLVAKMLRGPQGKRADFLVNITNDGWFKANENSQHLQVAIFRSIENRVPSARSVNTGVSGLIDSYGRVVAQVPTRTAGTATATAMFDSRYTVYTRFGDVFAIACVIVSAIMVARHSFIGWRAIRAALANARSGNLNNSAR